MKVAIIGQGYVGLPLAIAAARAGHEVTGIDSNASLISTLQGQKSPIGDLSDLQIAEAGKNYRATSDISFVEQSEIVIICVPTPLDLNLKPDLGLFSLALNSVSKYLKNETLVIIESTISPGTTRGLAKEILDKSSKKFFLAYSPERIDPANPKWGVTNTPKLVAGLDIESTNRALNFYKTFINDVITASSVEIIETAKLLENSFRLVNISFVNEFADFCHKMGIDVREVIDAAATKPYGFMPFYPGAGVGGHCIPVDPSYLVEKAKEIGAPTKFIDLANQINNSMGSYFANLAERQIGNLSGKKILLVGVAYKPNVADARETPALRIFEALKYKSVEVSYHDSLIKEWEGMKSVAISENFDLAILINPHSNTDLKALKNVKILDTRGGY